MAAITSHAAPTTTLDVFLDALDSALPSMTSLGLDWLVGEWPRGMCTIASKTAGRYLSEFGHGDWLLVTARDSGNRGHSWLEFGPLFYDPTMQKFSGFTSAGRGVGPNPIQRRYRYAAGQPRAAVMYDDREHAGLRSALLPTLQEQLAARDVRATGQCL